MSYDLYNGDWIHTEKQNAVYYRGDGANTCIYLPENKTVDSVTPFHPYTVEVLDDNTARVTFTPAIDNGALIKVSLRDNP